MGSIAVLFMYLMIIGFISVVEYFVIKEAVKDGIKDAYEDITRKEMKDDIDKLWRKNLLEKIIKQSNY